MAVAYKKLSVVDLEEVPDWQRREPKWDELVQDVLALEPGKSLPVLFQSKKAAMRARNAVRDRANLELGKPLIKTRLDVSEDGNILYFVRLKPRANAEEEITEE